VLFQETIDFLGRTHPLDLLPPAAVEELCESAGLEYFRRGATILEQGGVPSRNLYVLTRGTVKMFLRTDDGGELVLDYRGEGEYFGFLSLISGDSPRANVCAEEDSIALLIPKDELVAVFEEHPGISDSFLKSYFLEVIDKTYEETRRRYSCFTDGHRVLFSTPVGEVIRRQPVSTDAGSSIQDAARLMAAQKISSLVVTDRSGVPVGIMTDRDLREKIVAEGRDLGNPVSSIMSSPIIQVDASEPCSEALFRMMRHNIHHVLVTADGEFRGMVTNHDFMVLQGSSPTLLVRKVTEAHTLEQLDDVRHRLERTVASLSREGAKARDVLRVITEVTRTLIGKTVDLSDRDSGDAAVPLTVFLYGEAGRSEMSLSGGPKIAITYDGGHRDSGEAVVSACEALRRQLASVSPSIRLVDTAKALGSWREDLWQWLDGTIEMPPEGVGLLEMSAVTGGARQLEALRTELVDAAADSASFRERLLRTALENRPPLGFMGRLVVGDSGEQRHKLDLSRQGIAPLVDIVRVLALEKGLVARSTLGRLAELRARYGYAHADEIENAFEYLQTLRLHQQLADLEANEAPGDFLDPATLASGEKRSLKEAFQLIVSLYDGLSRKYGVRSDD
jgi:CBS domain-containing protein